MNAVHHCHAKGCITPCKPEFLMCGAHWSKVPVSVQRLVYATYRPGQCDDMNPSPEWHDAADLAIACVALDEGRGQLLSARQRALWVRFRFGLSKPRGRT